MRTNVVRVAQWSRADSGPAHKSNSPFEKKVRGGSSRYSHCLPVTRDNVTEGIWGDLDLFSEEVHEFEVPLMRNPVRRAGDIPWNVLGPGCRVPRRLDSWLWRVLWLRELWAMPSQLCQLHLHRHLHRHLIRITWSLDLGLALIIRGHPFLGGLVTLSREP